MLLGLLIFQNSLHNIVNSVKILLKGHEIILAEVLHFLDLVKDILNFILWIYLG